MDLRISCNFVMTHRYRDGCFNNCLPSGAPQFTPVFSGIRVTRSLVLWRMFCRSLFVFLSFFFWPLCRLLFFDLRILITPLVSSNYVYQTRHTVNSCIFVDTNCRGLKKKALWWIRKFVGFSIRVSTYINGHTSSLVSALEYLHI